MRISAYDLHTGGWLDNVATTQDFTYLGTHSNADYIDLREDYNSSDKSGYKYVLLLKQKMVLLLICHSLSKIIIPMVLGADINEGARKVSRYTPETFDDEFSQASLTMSGALTESIDFTFTSSMFDRDIAYTYDYTQYVYYFGYDYYAAYIMTMIIMLQRILEFSIPNLMISKEIVMNLEFNQPLIQDINGF